MKRIPRDTTEPGHFEVDLMHHGGEYAHTIQLIDVATCLSERMVILGRGQLAMDDGF